MEKSYVYFMTNKNKSVIYIGVTANLVKRVYEHKVKLYKGFTAKYNCDKLVYFEEFLRIDEAYYREKQVQGWNRKKKTAIIQQEGKKLPVLSMAYRDLE